MAGKTECGAHSLLMQNLDGLRKGQEQLYNLDRGKAAEMSEIKISVARLEESTKAGFSSVKEWQDAFEEKQGRRDAELNANMSKLISLSSRRKWTPRAKIALLSAVIGPSGLAAAVFLFVK
jgi:hypothetical protein